MSPRASFATLAGALLLAGAVSAGPAVADVDTTPPVITVTVPAEGQVIASDQGGFPTAFSCADEAGGSGLATCAGDATLDTTKVGDQQFTVHTSDHAGNATDKIVNYRVVDMIAPQITITAPTEGQHVPLHSTLPSTFDCTDTGGSLIDTCQGTQIIESPSVGPHQFTVLAIDGAGNRITKSVNYVVDPVSGPAGNQFPSAAEGASAGVKALPGALKRLRRTRGATLGFDAPPHSRVTVVVKRGGLTVTKASGFAGGDGAVRLQLSPASSRARRLLRGHAKLRLSLSVTVRDQGNTVRKAKTVSVKR